MAGIETQTELAIINGDEDTKLNVVEDTKEDTAAGEPQSELQIIKETVEREIHKLTAKIEGLKEDQLYIAGIVRKLGGVTLDNRKKIESVPSLQAQDSSLAKIAKTFAIIFICVVVVSHTWLGIALWFISVACERCCEETCENNARTAQFVMNAMMYGGFVWTPIIIVSILLFYLEWYDEVQSWMIAYVTWGVVSYCITMIYVVATTAIESRERKTKMMRFGNRIVMFICGVDFGSLDLVELLEEGLNPNDIRLWILQAMPTLAALLPSAISGFIANFMLEEKFELKCRDDIMSNICSEDGCCEIVSSHNWKNTYLFMGGLASNILAMWAIIRICGYLLAKSHPDFAVHAKRVKQ